MKAKRVIGVSVMLLLFIAAWLVVESGKHAKPTAVRISSVNKVSSLSVPISILATNTSSH